MSNDGIIIFLCMKHDLASEQRLALFLIPMESSMQFGYTIIFVPDVAAAVDFYGRAFGLKAKMVSKAFGMLETGATTLAFGSEDNEAQELGPDNPFRSNLPDAEPAGLQVSFIADDVPVAFALAVSAGATEVYAPRQMPWGQWVSRVRDLNGVLVSIVTAPRF
jgi:lactoylglutathione lyase